MSMRSEEQSPLDFDHRCKVYKQIIKLYNIQDDRWYEAINSRYKEELVYMCAQQKNVHGKILRKVLVSNVKVKKKPKPVLQGEWTWERLVREIVAHVEEGQGLSATAETPNHRDFLLHLIHLVAKGFHELKLIPSLVHFLIEFWAPVCMNHLGI